MFCLDREESQRHPHVSATSWTMLIPATIYFSSARSQLKFRFEFWIGHANPEGFGRLPMSLSGIPLISLAPREPVNGEGPYLHVLCMRSGVSETRGSL